PQQLIKGNSRRKKQREHNTRHEQHRYQRYTANHFDKDDADGFNNWQLRAATQGEHYSKRQRNGNAHERQNQSDQQSAPKWRFNIRQSKPAADQQKISDYRKYDKEQDCVDYLARYFGNKQRS